MHTKFTDLLHQWVWMYILVLQGLPGSYLDLIKCICLHRGFLAPCGTTAVCADWGLEHLAG